MDDRNRLLIATLMFLICETLPLSALGMPTKPCRTGSPDASYLATFELAEKDVATRKMIFCVPSKASSSPAQAKLANAEIWSEKGREAVCEQKYFERDGQAPLSLIFECRSAHFSQFVTPVTLFWPTTEMTKPVLRFGSWLNGYVQTPLLVQRDEFSKPVSVTARIAKSD